MPTTIPAGSASTPFTITTPDTYTLAAGTTRTQTAGTGIQATVSTGTTSLVIDGSLVHTASGARAIRAALKDGQLSVGQNGLVQSLDADAFQEQALSGGVLSTVNLTNLGRILSTTSVTTIQPVSSTQPSGYALNYNAALGAAGAPSTDFTSGGVVTNGAAAVTTALIRSDSADAIRLGAHQTVVNYGTIDGRGQVNDSSANNALAGTSTAERYDSSRGVRINAATATNDRIDNYGLITAAQHAVDVGNTAATNILVNNFAGGQLIGRNGSGVGADTTGIAAGTVVVTNSGLIRGAYAPLFDRAGLATLDGDGDGVDVDGGATVTNLAGGIIEGTGAGGYDSSGRLNNSEGISIGGGTITNSGIIRGAAFGIVVNNDSNPNGSRSGVLATQVTNAAAGTITGQGGYAFRSENRTGTAAGDDDTIVNYGTIAGNGTIPDTAQTVRIQDGTADPNTVGALDGRTYGAADAGSVRFIRGDGSAVQTGEGADGLSNYGTLTGATGLALDLEGGGDTLNLYTGSTVSGRLDGGAGSDTLNLRLDDRSGANAETGANSGAVTGTLADAVDFETLNVQGGAWAISDSEAFVSGAAVSNGAALNVAAGGILDAAVAVASGGSLGGAGRTGAVTVQAGGVLGPGDGTLGTGTLSTAGLVLAAGAVLREQIGTAADQVRVAGSVDLGGATLDIAALSGFAASSGRRYTLIDNDGGDVVAGRFTDTGGRILDQNALIQLGGTVLQISYAGGDGNDVVLTDVTPAAAPARRVRPS